jgi:acetyl esterase/lipase
MMGRRAFVGGFAAALASASAAAQQWSEGPLSAAKDLPDWPPKERFPLWPGRPPGAPSEAIVPKWTMDSSTGRRELLIRGVPSPEINVYRAKRPDGSAVLVMPGGGYYLLSVQNEGADVARFLNGQGTTAFVLTYRLPGEGWSERKIVPLQDAQRAMRLIRSRAAEFRIDPERLGAMGFSAGGHLAADLGVAHAEQVYPPIDAADRLSARPAYLGLIYPVTTLVNATSEGKDWDMLTGPAPKAELEKRSPLLRVTKDVPPSFLVHAMDDGGVLPWHSFRWVEALGKVGVESESHFFSEGGHGFGMSLAKSLPGSRWSELFALWMRKHGS